MQATFEIMVGLIPPLLAGIFAFALGAKLRDWPDLVDWLQQLGLPGPRASAIVGLTSEAAVSISLVVTPGVGLMLATLWLTGASLLLIRARTVNAPCACFGRSNQAASPLARNAFLLAAALVGFATVNPAVVTLDVRAAVALLGPGALAVQSVRES